MDFNKLKSMGTDMLNKNEGSTNTNTNTAAQPQGDNTNAQAATGSTNTAAAGSQDYGDKAFGFLAKKSGHNVDQNTSEKITDGARGLYEKATGSKVDSKYSN